MKYTLHLRACEWILLAMLVMAGCFHEYVACGAAAAIASCLVIQVARRKRLLIRKNVAAGAVLLTTLCYLIAVLYAVDRGMALTGFFKVLPVLLFILLVMQEEGGAQLLHRLPYYALGMGVISLFAQWIPGVEGYFVVAGRMAGFFQYPNTFAAFLLVGELLLLGKPGWKWYSILQSGILLLLILLTGSRSVFVLAVVSNLILLFWKLGKRGRILLGSAVVVLGVGASAALPLFRDNPVVGRLFTISLLESTFVGRLLYAADALPLLLQHPFGLGYMGHYYMQQSIQTGVYAVKYLHNDVLQLALDIGWVPCLVMIGAVIRALTYKEYDMGHKMALATLSVHCLLDFDLQFSAVFCVFALLLGVERGKALTVRVPVGVAVGGLGVLAFICMYFCVALGLPYWGQSEMADTMYGLNTENQIRLLMEEPDLAKRAEIADEILQRNEYVVIAYSAKSQYAYSQGNFQDLIQYKSRILELAPFGYEEYEEYSYMLAQGIYLYELNGDMESAKICAGELIKTRERLHHLGEKLSVLGRLIVDQPRTELPEDLETYIDQLEAMQ